MWVRSLLSDCERSMESTSRTVGICVLAMSCLRAGTIRCIFWSHASRLVSQEISRCRVSPLSELFLFTSQIKAPARATPQRGVPCRGFALLLMADLRSRPYTLELEKETFLTMHRHSGTIDPLCGNLSSSRKQENTLHQTR